MYQRISETFDAYANRVKHEAKNGDTCVVVNVMVRDQIIVGTTDDEIRKSALNQQWNLTDLWAKGCKIEAATFGAAKIKKEQKIELEEAEIGRVKPGRYFRKGNGQKAQACKNCSNKTCEGGDKCYGYGKECFQCGGKGHFKGADNCRRRERRGEYTQPARRVKDATRDVESGCIDELYSSGEEDPNVKYISRSKQVKAARFISHVRRAGRGCQMGKNSRNQVPVVIKGKMVTFFADTGADVSVIPKQLAM